jgi:hypothetical protein
MMTKIEALCLAAFGAWGIRLACSPKKIVHPGSPEAVSRGRATPVHWVERLVRFLFGAFALWLAAIAFRGH